MTVSKAKAQALWETWKTKAWITRGITLMCNYMQQQLQTKFSDRFFLKRKIKYFSAVFYLIQRQETQKTSKTERPDTAFENEHFWHLHFA